MNKEEKELVRVADAWLCNVAERLVMLSPIDAGPVTMSIRFISVLAAMLFSNRCVSLGAKVISSLTETAPFIVSIRFDDPLFSKRLCIGLAIERKLDFLNDLREEKGFYKTTEQIIYTNLVTAARKPRRQTNISRSQEFTKALQS